MGRLHASSVSSTCRFSAAKRARIEPPWIVALSAIRKQGWYEQSGALGTAYFVRAGKPNERFQAVNRVAGVSASPWRFRSRHCPAGPTSFRRKPLQGTVPAPVSVTAPPRRHPPRRPVRHRVARWECEHKRLSFRGVTSSPAPSAPVSCTAREWHLVEVRRSADKPMLLANMTPFSHSRTFHG